MKVFVDTFWVKSKHYTKVLTVDKRGFVYILKLVWKRIGLVIRDESLKYRIHNVLQLDYG